MNLWEKVRVPAGLQRYKQNLLLIPANVIKGSVGLQQFERSLSDAQQGKQGTSMTLRNIKQRYTLALGNIMKNIMLNTQQFKNSKQLMKTIKQLQLINTNKQLQLQFK